jgi:hypothetical protein
MVSIRKIFLKPCGRIKGIYTFLCAIIGVSLIIVPWQFSFFNRGACYFLMCLGAVIGGFAAYADRYGFITFSDDPVGWRKAKASYKAEADSDGNVNKL